MIDTSFRQLISKKKILGWWAARNWRSTQSTRVKLDAACGA
jgi:hypothetical protein